MQWALVNGRSRSERRVPPGAVVERQAVFAVQQLALAGASVSGGVEWL
jgi:hypothetical protein